MGTCTAVTPSCTTAPALAANFTYQPSNIALTDINQQASMAADEVISAACTVETDAFVSFDYVLHRARLRQ